MRRGTLVLAEGRRVVAIERNTESDRTGPLRAVGGLVLAGDARSADTLLRAGILRAAHVVAISEDDGMNAEIVAQAEALAGARGRPLACVAQILDPKLCVLLREQELERSGPGGVRLDLFNAFESAARQLLDDFPLSVNLAGRRVVIAGVGRFGESVVAEAARRRLFEPDVGEKLRFTLVDRAAAAQRDLLLQRHPHVARACEIEAIALEGDRKYKRPFETPRTGVMSNPRPLGRYCTGSGRAKRPMASTLKISKGSKTHSTNTKERCCW